VRVAGWTASEEPTAWKRKKIIEPLVPCSPLDLCMLPPVFLDYYLNDDEGYDLPGLRWSNR
jgi:hypothetical protein